MKRKLACALGALLLATGCASVDGGKAVEVASSTPAATVAIETLPEPEPEPKPKPMSLAAAGAYYLQHVCRSNQVGDRFNDVLFAAVDKLNAGGAPKLAPLKKVAAESRDSSRDLADAFTDEEVLWPKAVEKDIRTLVDFQYDEAASLSGMAEAKSVDQYLNIMQSYEQMVADSDGPAASQKIRAKLDLAADTVKTCEKYTG